MRFLKSYCYVDSVIDKSRGLLSAMILDPLVAPWEMALPAKGFIANRGEAMIVVDEGLRDSDVALITMANGDLHVQIDDRLLPPSPYGAELTRRIENRTELLIEPPILELPVPCFLAPISNLKSTQTRCSVTFFSDRLVDLPHHQIWERRWKRRQGVHDATAKDGTAANVDQEALRLSEGLTLATIVNDQVRSTWGVIRLQSETKKGRYVASLDLCGAELDISDGLRLMVRDRDGSCVPFAEIVGLEEGT